MLTGGEGQVDYRIVAAVIAAIVGGVTGVISSLVAPWVNWRIEKVRLRTEGRRKRIEEWRHKINYTPSFEIFTRSPEYQQLMEKLPPKDRGRLTRTYLEGGPDKAEEEFKRGRLNELVNELELKWKLI